MNVMSGHVILFEIQSNLSCCPLIILDLQQGAVGATDGHASTSQGHHQDGPTECFYTCCSHILLCINDIKSYFLTKQSYLTQTYFLCSEYEDFSRVFKDTSAGQKSCFWQNCCGDKICDFPLTRRSLRWASCHSPVSDLKAKSKTAVSRLLMKHCHPSTGFVDRVIYSVEQIDAWTLETEVDVTLSPLNIYFFIHFCDVKCF